MSFRPLGCTQEKLRENFHFFSRGLAFYCLSISIGIYCKINEVGSNTKPIAHSYKIKPRSLGGHGCCNRLDLNLEKCQPNRCKRLWLMNQPWRVGHHER